MIVLFGFIIQTFTMTSFVFHRKKKVIRIWNVIMVSNWWQHFNFSLLFNRMTALCVEYYLQHMSQEVLQMHNFQLLNPYCRVKGLSALDFKAFPCITFAFPTALKRHSAVFFLKRSKHFLLSHSHRSSFSRAQGSSSSYNALRKEGIIMNRTE